MPTTSPRDPATGSAGRRRPVVVLLCDSLPPYRVRVHRRLTRELPGVAFVTACTHDPQDGRWPAVSQADVPHVVFGPGERSGERLGNRRFFAAEFRKGGRIVRWLRRARPAAVVINGYNDPGRLRVLAWCKANGVPALLQGDSNVRGDRAAGVRRVVKRAVVGTFARAFDAFLPFGSLGRAYFRRYGAADSRIFEAPLEPDYDLIAAVGPGAAAVAAARFSLPAGRRRLLYSGRLAPEKRVDLAIKAFAAIADRRPAWDLVVMGDGPLRDELRAQVPPALARRVAWTGGLTEPGAIFGLFAACDAFVLPSDAEPWALVINEAAASGLAIVCSDAVGAAPELVRDGVNGRVFPRGDAAALAAALLDVTDEARLPQMRAASGRVLADWRRHGDPVDGFRRALRRVGVPI
ncbi:MAG TPA: glycosyltransferase [Humisphaera sp.]